MISLSSQKKAESDLLIISNLLSNFMAYTFLQLFSLTWMYKNKIYKIMQINKRRRDVAAYFMLGRIEMRMLF